MKAAVCYEYGKPLIVEEIAMEAPKKGEVCVRIAATAICHSDIHSVKGEHGTFGKLPALGGHEIAGVIEGIGEDVSYVKPGDSVLLCLVRAGCGHCYYCITGHPNFCENWHFNFQSPGPFHTKKGEQLTLFPGPFAGFQEKTIAPEGCLVKIPPEMPKETAALLGCGVISGFGAIVNAAKVAPFSSVVVTGTGGVGLNAIQGARFVGANPIIAIDVVDSKLETAKTFGATHTINARKEKDPVAAVKSMTEGRGADHVFITVAGIQSKRQGFLMLSAIGKEFFIGHGNAEPLAEWDAVEFVGGRTITGSAMGRSRIRIDIPNFIKLYQTGRLKLDELISNRFSLDRINEAFEDSEKGESLRNVIIL